MWKKIAIASFVLWFISAGFLIYKIQFGTAVKVDKRIEISLAPAERELVLKEMRILLKGVKGIIRGLSQNDFKVVKMSATSNGMVMAQDINPALMTKLPMPFKQMGIGVHKKFDTLAGQVDSMNQQQILKEVDNIMVSCVTCHEMYKITDKVK